MGEITEGIARYNHQKILSHTKLNKNRSILRDLSGATVRKNGHTTEGLWSSFYL